MTNDAKGIDAAARAIAETADMKGANYTGRGVYVFEGRSCIDVDGAIDLIDVAQAAIRAYLAAMEAEAVMVPVEPTEAMVSAGEAAVSSCSKCHLQSYRAMLASRPRDM